MWIHVDYRITWSALQPHNQLPFTSDSFWDVSILSSGCAATAPAYVRPGSKTAHIQRQFSFSRLTCTHLNFCFWDTIDFAFSQREFLPISTWWFNFYIDSTWTWQGHVWRLPWPWAWLICTVTCNKISVMSFTVIFQTENNNLLYTVGCFAVPEEKAEMLSLWAWH